MSMYPPGKWSEGEPNEGETFSRSPIVQEGLAQGTIVFDKSWPHPFSQTEASQPNTDTESMDIDKKSAKDRFFEACGAKAVISVLCTQESISEPNIRMPELYSADSHSSATTTGSSTVDNSEQTPEPPDVTYTATRPLSDRGAAKIRFFGSKEDELLTSRLFVQTVRYSIDSDVLETEKSSVPNSPTLVEEEEPKGEDDDDDDDSTSAKSRFLLSCKDEKDGEKKEEAEAEEEEEEEQEEQEEHADDEASSMATESNLARRSKRQPETNKVRGELKQLPSLTIRESDDEDEESSSSSDDDREMLHSISSRGSDRYRGFREASNEDIGFFDSDDSEDDDSEEDLETDCSSITSMGTDSLSGAGARTPSIGTPSPIEEKPPHVGMSTVTRPSIKYTNIWSATAGSPDLHSETAIVLDNGSEILKAGMAGSYLPSIVIPTVIGRQSETSGDLARAKTKRAFIGHEVMGSKHGAMSFDYPIEDGIVDNWNDLEAIWEHVMLQELALTTGEHPVLLSEIASAPREQREKCLEVMFEKLNVPALYVANQAALALYANADTSGLVLSSGSGITEVVPVLDGNTLKHAVTTLDIAGKEVTRQLGRLLQMERGYSFSSSSERETLRNMKESLAYVCSDYEAEMLKVKHTAAAEYRLPDGSPLSIGQTDLFRCTEPLFQPDIFGILHQSGMANLITESLQRCDSEFLSTREPSILLTGGNTKITGFVDRFQSELTRAKVDRVITAPEERIYSTWVGGSILASHSSFSERWISTDDYSEHGANIVNRRSSLF
ncbi:uncharacterized protein [Amphiura filiformis]|uniref:uncharacterized protein n=1 Tax=Amphiura filiformis TaxID=82378 RepID=UPI003B222491